MLDLLLAVSAVYLAIGIVFAIPFAWRGAGRLDPAARDGSWGFRVCILPGVAALWPILAIRWARGDHSPPVERSAHRDAVATDGHG